MKIILKESQYKLLLETKNAGTILIVGDSHSVDNGNRYSSLIKNDYSNVDIIAIGGKRTSWMKEELKKALENKKYDKVFIYGGNNDTFSNVGKDAALNNIQDMVNMVNSQGGKSYIISGFDTESMIDGNYTEPTKDNSGNVLASTDTLKKMRQTYIDFQKSLEQITSATIIPTLKLDKSNVWPDNVHYNNSAHKSMYDYLKPYVEDKVSKTNVKIDGLENINSVAGFFISIFNAFFKIFGIDKVINLNGKLVADASAEILQNALKYLKYFPEDYKPDGIFDSETESAVRKFQSENGLSVDGELDSEDMEKLIKILEDKGFNLNDLKKLKNQTFESSNTLEQNSFSVLRNPPMKINTYPSDIESKFKNAVGEDLYNDFISDCDSINLDTKIAIRQLYTESIGFRPDVLNCTKSSPAGALGIAQFMPSTWNNSIKDGPCSSSKPNEGCCDVKKALKGYIKEMKKNHLDVFPERLDLAVASYNSGPNYEKYKKALEEKTPFGELNTKYAGIGLPIPDETLHYVFQILQP